MNNTPDDNYVIFILRVNYFPDIYKTFGKLNRIIKTDKEDLIENFNNLLDMYTEDYYILRVKRVIIEFIPKFNKKGDLKDISTLQSHKKLTQPAKELYKTTNKILNINLPLNMNYTS